MLLKATGIMARGIMRLQGLSFGIGLPRALPELIHPQSPNVSKPKSFASGSTDAVPASDEA